MKVKLFTQPTCPKCPAAKEIIKKVEHKFQVEYHDIKTAEGLAEALDYGIMSTPSIVLLDDNGTITKQWVSTVPAIDELMKY